MAVQLNQIETMKKFFKLRIHFKMAKCALTEAVIEEELVQVFTDSEDEIYSDDTDKDPDYLK